MEVIPWLIICGLVFTVFPALTGIQRRLATVEKNLQRVLIHFNIDAATVLPPSDRVRHLAADPKGRIAAMKAYREETGADLPDAKSVVDALIAGQK
jgi:hypothetical protein